MNKTFFAPHLTIRNGVSNVDFYIQAFDAIELRRFSNDDGSIHVSELSIDGNIFHLHEAMGRPNSTSPDQHNFSTVTIGLFVPDVDVIMQKAVGAGATEISPAQDYEYGYRQGEIRDTFGHYWLIEQKIQAIKKNI